MIGFRRWLLRPLFKEIHRMSQALDRLRASMEANTSATASALALISTLASEIRANVDDSDALNAIADKLDQDSHDLAAAVTANTPSDPENAPRAPVAPGALIPTTTGGTGNTNVGTPGPDDVPTGGDAPTPAPGGTNFVPADQASVPTGASPSGADATGPVDNG